MFSGETILLGDGKYIFTPDTQYMIDDYIDPLPDFKTYANETFSFNRYNQNLNEYQYFSLYRDFVNIPADLINSRLEMKFATKIIVQITPLVGMQNISKVQKVTTI
jgi:hypothetical protein